MKTFGSAIEGEQIKLNCWIHFCFGVYQTDCFTFTQLNWWVLLENNFEIHYY